MISFKLSKEKHTSVSRIVKQITWLCYIVGMIFVLYTGVGNYLTAKKIMSNHQIVDANLSFEGTTTKHKRKRDVITYHFKYQFAVGDAEYAEQFTTSESSADSYMNKNTIQVAYNVDNPSLHGRLTKLASDTDIMSWIKRFVISIPLFGLLAFIIYILITRRLFVVRAEA